MNKAFGFWIVPENKVYTIIQKIITKYSRKLDVPLFVPHMTLMGEVEGKENRIVEQVKEIAKELKPFDLNVGKVEFSSTYFQCVFARVNTTAKLMNAHLALSKAFNQIGKHVYMPHMSLVYSDIDMNTREKLSKEIKLPFLEFTAKKLSIVRADSPDPKTWEIVVQIPFGKH